MFENQQQQTVLSTTTVLKVVPTVGEEFPRIVPERFTSVTDVAIGPIVRPELTSVTEPIFTPID